MLCPRFWLTLAEFKRVYPLDKPIRVKYMVKTKNWASHQETENYHCFWFDRHTPVRMQIELLIHEYAHAKDHTPCRVDHRNSWGVWYARLYRVWEKLSEQTSYEGR